MDYVINKTVIEAAKGGNKYTSDLLMPFSSNETPHNVVKNNKILEEYQNIADDFIRTWINLVANMDFWVNVECTEEPIFIKTCQKTYDKKLIVSNKTIDYPNYEGLIPIDKDEAIAEIASSKITINQTGNGNKATVGNSSSIDA